MTLTALRGQYAPQTTVRVDIDPARAIVAGYNVYPYGADIEIDATKIPTEQRQKLGARIRRYPAGKLDDGSFYYGFEVISLVTGKRLTVAVPTLDGLWDAIMEDEDGRPD